MLFLHRLKYEISIIDFLFTLYIIYILTKIDFNENRHVDSSFNTADRRGNHVLSRIAVLERSADKSSNLCGEREGNHQMINDNDAPLKNRSFRFLRGSQWRVRESDRWRVVRPRTHTHTLADRSGWWAREQKETGCEDTL